MIHPSVTWQKSSYSGGDGAGGNCVELADLGDGTRAVRDSKNPMGAVLRFQAGQVAAFTSSVRAGEFD